MTRWAALGLVAAVAMGHALYYAWPAGSQRRWAAYVFGGAAFAAVCYLRRPQAAERATEAGAVASAACWWGVFEGLQQAGCGALGWGMAPTARDLCVELLGPWPYVLAASVLLALFVTRKKL